MDIGPITVIRPVSMVRPSPPGSESGSDSGSELNGVFAAEFRNQQPDDSYSPARKASRGLEDENTEEDSADSDSAARYPSNSTQNSINFFA
jgi:hypothetical protein